VVAAASGEASLLDKVPKAPCIRRPYLPEEHAFLKDCYVAAIDVLMLVPMVGMNVQEETGRGSKDLIPSHSWHGQAEVGPSFM
jgi:hypothetical protein